MSPVITTRYPSDPAMHPPATGGPMSRAKARHEERNLAVRPFVPMPTVSRPLGGAAAGGAWAAVWVPCPLQSSVLFDTVDGKQTDKKLTIEGMCLGYVDRPFLGMHI